MPIGAGLMSPPTLLFNRPMRVMLPQMNRETINVNPDNERYEALKEHQDKYLKGKIITKTNFFSYRVYSKCVVREW